MIHVQCICHISCQTRWTFSDTLSDQFYAGQSNPPNVAMLPQCAIYKIIISEKDQDDMCHISCYTCISSSETAKAIILDFAQLRCSPEAYHYTKSCGINWQVSASCYNRLYTHCDCSGIAMGLIYGDCRLIKSNTVKNKLLQPSAAITVKQSH